MSMENKMSLEAELQHRIRLAGHAMTEALQHLTGERPSERGAEAALREGLDRLYSIHPSSEATSSELNERWWVDETEEDYAIIYVDRETPDGEPYAHVLFEADWGTLEQARHIADLHNATRAVPSPESEGGVR